MNLNKMQIVIINIVIFLGIIIIINITRLTKFNSKKLPSDESIYDYIIDLWACFDEDNIEKYTEQQLVVISITAYDAEVNNGGLCQFFANSSRIFAPNISENLELINAKMHKAHFDEFINQNNIDTSALNSFISEDADEFIDQYDRYSFDDFDMNFYELEQTENLYDLVIKYAKDNYDEIFTDI